MRLAKCIRPGGDEWNLECRKLNDKNEVRLPEHEDVAPAFHDKWVEVHNSSPIGMLLAGPIAFTRIYYPEEDK